MILEKIVVYYLKIDFSLQRKKRRYIFKKYENTKQSLTLYVMICTKQLRLQFYIQTIIS